MTKLKMLRTVAAASSGLVLSLGVVGIASASHSEMGKKSGGSNTSSVDSSVVNTNKVGVTNNNSQNAVSGEAEVKGQAKSKSHDHDYTEGASSNAGTGKADNDNVTNLAVDVSNSAKVHASDSDKMSDGDKKGSNQKNSSTVNTSVVDTNDVMVTNNNTQNAVTGNAKVENNKQGGSAMSGNASNANNTTVSVSVSN